MQILSKGESLDLVLVNEPNVDLQIRQEENSSLRLHIIDFAPAHNHIQILQDGSGCLTEIYHLAWLRDADQVQTHTSVRHMVGGGTSRQVLKFVLDGESRGEFLGELYIAPDAQKTEAQQTNRNLLLSPRALMRTQPQLEIYADDVKASHGASTGQLDESALFYMQQRCLDPQQARKMLIAAFMSDVLLTIRDEKKREELLQTIDSIVQ